LKKRLDEFKATPSGSLTLADFRNVWLEEEMDPPAYTKGKEKEEAERKERERIENGEVDEEDEEFGKKKSKKKKGKGRKGKRKRSDDDEDDQEDSAEPEQRRQGFDPSLLSNGILAGALDAVPPPPPTDMDLSNIDPVLLGETLSTALNAHAQQLEQASLRPLQVPPVSIPQGPSPITPTLEPPPSTLVDETVTMALAEEVSTFLHNKDAAALASALDEAEQRRLAEIEERRLAALAQRSPDDEDDLGELDEEELDRFILTEEEVKIKERVWVELNRDYLEALAGECLLLFLVFSVRGRWV